MKVRVSAAIVLVAALFLGACGGESDEEKAQKAFADAMEELTKDLPSSDTDTDTDTVTSLPNLENAGECIEVGLTYASLGLVSLGGMMGEEISDADLAELDDAIAELSAKLPKEIQSDFAVVAKGYNTAAKEGFASGKAQAALESDDFVEANERVGAYIEELCS